MDTCIEGGCQCGAVRYRIDGAPIATALCHCISCRRASGAPAVAWAMARHSQFRYTAAEPAAYESSPGCRRSFCGRCGTSLVFEADYLPGVVDVTVGSLDDPAAVRPELHMWEAERLPWLQTGDELPRHGGFPPME